MKTPTNRITISLTQKQADALAWIIEYGINEKLGVLEDPDIYSKEETAEFLTTIARANEVLDVLRNPSL